MWKFAWTGIGEETALDRGLDIEQAFARQKIGAWETRRRNQWEQRHGGRTPHEGVWYGVAVAEGVGGDAVGRDGVLFFDKRWGAIIGLRAEAFDMGYTAETKRPPNTVP